MRIQNLNQLSHLLFPITGGLQMLPMLGPLVLTPEASQLLPRTMMGEPAREPLKGSLQEQRKVGLLVNELPVSDYWQGSCLTSSPTKKQPSSQTQLSVMASQEECSGQALQTPLILTKPLRQKQQHPNQYQLKPQTGGTKVVQDWLAALQISLLLHWLQDPLTRQYPKEQTQACWAEEQVWLAAHWIRMHDPLTRVQFWLQRQASQAGQQVWLMGQRWQTFWMTMSPGRQVHLPLRRYWLMAQGLLGVHCWSRSSQEQPLPHLPQKPLMGQKPSAQSQYRVRILKTQLMPQRQHLGWKQFFITGTAGLQLAQFWAREDTAKNSRRRSSALLMGSLRYKIQSIGSRYKLIRRHLSTPPPPPHIVPHDWPCPLGLARFLGVVLVAPLPFVIMGLQIGQFGLGSWHSATFVTNPTNSPTFPRAVQGLSPVVITNLANYEGSVDLADNESSL